MNNNTLTKEKRVIWSDKEVEYLLLLYIKNDIVAQLESRKYKKNTVFESLVPLMAVMNYRRTAEQIRTKMKQLKHIYLQAKKTNMTCPFYYQLNEIYANEENNMEALQHSDNMSPTGSLSLLNPKIEFVLCGEENNKDDKNSKSSEYEEELDCMIENENRNQIDIMYNDDNSSLLDSSVENDVLEPDTLMDIDNFQKRKNKRHFNWNHTSNLAIIHLWNKNFNNLRLNKRNIYIYCHIKNVLEDKYKIIVSTDEIRNKIKNLTAKYKHEKYAVETLGIVSEWTYYDKVKEVMLKALEKANGESNTSMNSQENNEILNDWSKAEIKIFLDAFRAVSVNYKSNTCVFWKILSKYLKVRNVYKTPDECNTKWTELRIGYKDTDPILNNNGIFSDIRDDNVDAINCKIEPKIENADHIRILSVSSVAEPVPRKSDESSENKKHTLSYEDDYYELKKKILIEKQELLRKDMQQKQYFREKELEYSKQKLILLQKIVDTLQKK